MALLPGLDFVTEKDFQQTVIEYARALGYLVYHQIDMGRKDPETGRVTFSRRIGPGFPDLVIAGHGRVIFAELKSEKGKLSKAQEGWREALEPIAEWYLWRPSDWTTIENILETAQIWNSRYTKRWRLPMSTDPRITLLSRAEKDGKPVHNLRILHTLETHGEYLGEHPKRILCVDVDCPGFHANPDPMALIAAVLAVETHGKKLWTIHFWADDDVSIGLGNNYFRWRESNLTDAMIEATKALEPDNWEGCENCHGLGGFKGMPSGGPMGEDPFPDEMCQECAGTAIVIKEVTNGS